MPYISNIPTIYLIFAGVAFVLLAIDIVCSIFIFKLRKKMAILFDGKKMKNMEDIVLKHLQKTKAQEADIVELFNRVKRLELSSEKTFQKIGIVRFNPFSDIGGNQSFAVALLDNNNDGFVISSLFIKEGNRVYAKAVKGGQSDFSLSKEEKQALEEAIHYSGKNDK